MSPKSILASLSYGVPTAQRKPTISDEKSRARACAGSGSQAVRSTPPGDRPGNMFVPFPDRWIFIGRLAVKSCPYQSEIPFEDMPAISSASKGLAPRESFPLVPFPDNHHPFLLWIAFGSGSGQPSSQKLAKFVLQRPPPQGNNLPSVPRAAFSHSASRGRRAPAHWQ